MKLVCDIDERERLDRLCQLVNLQAEACRNHNRSEYLRKRRQLLGLQAQLYTLRHPEPSK